MGIAEKIIIYILTAVGSASLVAAAVKCFHILQLEGYKTRNYIKWFFSKGKKAFYALSQVSFLCLAFMTVSLMLFIYYDYFKYIGFAFLPFFLALYTHAVIKEPKKTPLKFTARIKRLIFAVALLTTAAVFCLTYFTYDFFFAYAFTGLLPVLLPFIVALAAIAVYPIELLIRKYYIGKAKKKLRSAANMKVIGITGSYGKTSARNILTAMLSTTYKTGSTGGSYNTPMGICKLINDADEKLEYDFYVAEMGARNVGDIKELCDILRPSYGLITAVGEQHLESFKTPENIAKTKYELAESVRGIGFTAFNCASKPNIPLYDKTPDAQRLASGRRGEGEYYASYSNTSADSEGISFDLETGGKSIKIKTRLLGKYNIENITLCAAAAHKLGVSLENIALACERLEPVPHRLQLIRAEAMTIIDDAYNSNPLGAEDALEVLSGFAGKKIIVTPGLVELGEKAEEYNTAFGRQIAAVCDYAYVTGGNAGAIIKGLDEGGFLEERRKTVSSLAEAVAEITKIEGEKVVLFENDLPDNM